MKRWLNQSTQRTVPGFVNILGEATNTATVSVLTAAGVFPASRHGAYWRAEVAVSNSVPLWLALTNIAVLQQGTNADLIATNRGHLLVPQTPETFTYDADGNLTSDSLWTNTWDGENRRTVIESRSGVPAAARVRVQWTHLPDGRWIERIVSTNSGTAYQPAFTNRYVWDGNVLLAVLNHTNGLELSFLRGLDLSGTPQGAGGVGGLLAVRVGPALPCGPLTNTTHFAAYDGNGNVAALVDAADGTESARYEYGPFGEPLRITGAMGKVNPIRFSTQYADDWTGDLKYLHRDYRPDLGRWPNRDPIEEKGGANLYGMLRNDTVNKLDVLGRDEWVGPPAPLPPIDPNKDVTKYNCAGVAFRDYTFKSKSDTLAKLKKDCTVTDAKSRCPCGQRKCAYYDITGLKVTDSTGKVVYDGPLDDFHIACGNEDGYDCIQKNGPCPLSKPGSITDHPPKDPCPATPGYKYEPRYTTTFYCCKP